MTAGTFVTLTTGVTVVIFMKVVTAVTLTIVVAGDIRGGGDSSDSGGDRSNDVNDSSVVAVSVVAMTSL